MSTSTTAMHPHIEVVGEEPAHLRRLPRIRISMIASAYLSHGYSPEEMCRQFPHLQLSEAYSAMAYYFDHQVQIDSEIEAEMQEYDQLRADKPISPFVRRLRELGVR